MYSVARFACDWIDSNFRQGSFNVMHFVCQSKTGQWTICQAKQMQTNERSTLISYRLNAMHLKYDWIELLILGIGGQIIYCHFKYNDLLHWLNDVLYNNNSTIEHCHSLADCKIIHQRTSTLVVPFFSLFACIWKAKNICIQYKFYSYECQSSKNYTNDSYIYGARVEWKINA